MNTKLIPSLDVAVDARKYRQLPAMWGKNPGIGTRQRSGGTKFNQF